MVIMPKLSQLNSDDFIDQKIKAIAATGGFVLDVGGGERFQKWLAPYRPLFRDCRFQTMDYDKQTGADVIGDIHKIPLTDNSVDSVICHSVLEHVENPLQAMREIHRILKPNGRAFVHVPSIYPYHARKGAYPDLWRIFDDTIPVLFQGFREVEFVKRGGYFKALFFFLPFQHKIRFIIDPLSTFLDKLFRTKQRHTTAGYYIYAEKEFCDL